jgi:diguanylate cyclase (GGDEF)-like protein
VIELTVWSIPPLLAVVVIGAIWFRLRANDHVPGVNALLLMLLAIGFTSMCQAIAFSINDDALKQITTRLAYFGVLIAPIAWFAFCLAYARRQLHLSRVVLNAVSVLPLVTVILSLTNDYHHLILKPGSTNLDPDPGPWFYVQQIYSFVLVIGSSAVLAYVVSLSQSNWRPIATMIAAPVIAITPTMIAMGSGTTPPRFVLHPLALALGSWVMYRGVLQFGLLDNIPVVRDRVINELSDPVVVVNHRGNIIDANQAALTMFNRPRHDTIDRSITQFMSNWPPTTLSQSGSANDDLTIGGQTYDVAFSLLDPHSEKSDVVLVFRDVTARREDERRLRKLQKELERLAHTDALTGLYNRRIFMQRLEEEVERVRRHGSTLSVLIFDLDFFKHINDTWGHDTGDVVLVAIARVATEIKRMSDIAARLGGEEFALLLPETDQQGAVQLAQRLRSAIEKKVYVSTSGAPVKVTASIGVATATKEARDVDKLLISADRQLYRAKNNGRNRVCSTTL